MKTETALSPFSRHCVRPAVVVVVVVVVAVVVVIHCWPVCHHRHIFLYAVLLCFISLNYESVYWNFDTSFRIKILYKCFYSRNKPQR